MRLRRPTLLFVLAIGALLIGAVYGRSEQLFHAQLSRAMAPPDLSFETPSIERGREIGEAIAQCTFCHAEDWGGKLVSDDWLVGRLQSSNLTPGRGGIGERYSDEDLRRAIRYGVGLGGRNLWFMPGEHYIGLSDPDLESLILYLRSLPAIDRVQKPPWPGPATRLAVTLGLAPELVPREPIAKRGRAQTPTPADGPAYGEYLVSIGICGYCHRRDLKGGRHPLAPPHEPVPPDITGTGAIADWSETEFRKALRQGITPEGSSMDPLYMPWPRYAQMNDEELSAIFRYLQSIP